MNRVDQVKENENSIVIEILQPGMTVLPSSFEECIPLLSNNSGLTSTVNDDILSAIIGEMTSLVSWKS